MRSFFRKRGIGVGNVKQGYGRLITAVLGRVGSRVRTETLCVGLPLIGPFTRIWQQTSSDGILLNIIPLLLK